MIRVYSFLFFLLALQCYNTFANVSILPDSISIGNKYIKREFKVTKNKFLSQKIIHIITKNTYEQTQCEEFSFTTDSLKIKCSDFKFISARADSSDSTVNKLVIELKGEKGSIKDLLATIVYKVYDEMPVIHKQVFFHNVSARVISITNFNSEEISLSASFMPVPAVTPDTGKLFQQLNSNKALRKCTVLHSASLNESVLLGNEAPGNLNRIECQNQPTQIIAGLSYINSPIPFKRVLMPGAEIDIPRTFVIFANTTDSRFTVFNLYTSFADKRQGNFLFSKNDTGLVVYTSTAFSSEKQLLIQVDSCAASGTTIFNIGDGWQKLYGEWTPNPKLFRKGLTPVSKYIRTKGMKAGLWFSLAAADSLSHWIADCPPLVMTNTDGSNRTLGHLKSLNKVYALSLGTLWFDEIYDVVKKAVRDYDLSYVYLDFKGAIEANGISGDYSFERKKYNDHESSYWIIYERTRVFLTELHKEYPELLIECNVE
jgi:alpha-galactosidase